jgi:Tfp pilus assembly protein PilE
MRRRLITERGLSLVEVTIMLLVLMLLTGVLAPSIMDFVRDAQWVKVKEDCEAIGVSVARLARDVGPCLKFDGTAPCTKANRVDILYSDGPDVTPGDMAGDATASFSGGAATAADLNWHNDDARGDSMEHQFVDNGTGPNYPSPADLGSWATSGPAFGLGWRGAYLSPPIGPDPWGHRYLVNSVFLATAVDAVSAGALGDGRVQTFIVPPRQPGPTASTRRPSAAMPRMASPAAATTSSTSSPATRAERRNRDMERTQDERETGARAMRHRLTTDRGLSLVEVTIMLLVLMLLTGVLTPSVMDFIHDAQWIKAKEDCEAIGVSVVRLARDVGPCLKFNGSGPCSKANRVDLIYSDGPDVTPGDVAGGSAADFAGGGNTAAALNWHTDGSRGDSMQHQFVDNGGPDYPSPADLGTWATAGPASGLGWRGAYLSSPVGPDPWGHRYLVNTVFLAVARDAEAGTGEGQRSGGWSRDTFCISAGPNGQYETPFGGNAAHGVDRRGDDLIFVISGDTR